MKVFKINKLLTLKFEKGESNIYVDNTLFRQCKFLLLEIPIDEIEYQEEIDSIDEAADILGWSVDGQEGVSYAIDPETEFWGHCSNLQAWYENDYDTRFLHSNLSFPLLKRLTEVGDPLALRVFKEEIARRFESGYPNLVVFILEERFLDYLNQEEREQLLERNFLFILNVIENLQYNAFSNVSHILIELISCTDVLNDYFPAFLNIADKLPEQQKSLVFSKLIEYINGTELLNINFLAILECINNLSDNEKTTVLSDLIHSIKDMKILSEFFPSLLKITDGLIDNKIYHNLLDLIKVIKDSEVLNEVFLELLKRIVIPEYDKGVFFSSLIDLIRNIEISNDNFTALLDVIITLPDLQRNIIFDELIESIKNTIFFDDHIPEILEKIVSDGWADYSLSSIIHSIKDAGLFDKHFSFIKTQFLNFVDVLDKLLYNDRNKYNAFYYTFDSIKGTLLFDEQFSLIEAHFLALLSHISELPDSAQYDVFSRLNQLAKETSLLEKHSSVLLGIFSNLPKCDKLVGWFKKIAYSKLIEAVKDTNLEKENAYKKWKEKFLVDMNANNQRL